MKGKGCCCADDDDDVVFLLLLLHPVQIGHYILSGTIVSVAGEPSQWNTKRHDGATLVGGKPDSDLCFGFNIYSL